MAPVIFCALIGFIWARNKVAYDAQFVTALVLNVAAPCLILSAISQSQLASQVFFDMALACVLVTAIMGILGSIIIKLLGDDLRVYLPSMMFANVGNMGLPLCLFAFGEQGLALALAFFMVLSIAHFPLGILLARGVNSKAELTVDDQPAENQEQGSALVALLKMPIIYAIIAALVLMVMGWQLPQILQQPLELVGAITIPLMLITLGVSLHSLRVRDWRGSFIYAGLRIFLGMAVGFMVAKGLQLEGAMFAVVIIQASMPVAVFNYLFALKYNRSPEQVAGMVVVSTLLAFVSLPLLFVFLL